MPDEPNIRAFEPADRPALQRVRARAFAPIFQSFCEIVGDEIATVVFAHADAEQAKLLDEVCQAGSPHHLLVVTLGGEVLGFVSFTVAHDKRIGEIGLNAVDPEHAGRGIGSWMYEHVLQRMTALGLAVATVSTGSDASHHPARRAYEKVGFGPTIPSVTYYKLL